MKKDNTAPEAKKPSKKDELEILRKELAEARARNDELSRQVAAQGAALDANIRAREARIEADMICIVNTNAANRDARDKRATVRFAKDKAMQASFTQSCTMSAITLGVEVVGAVALIIAGHCGAIAPELATAFAFVLLPAIGWTMRDCSLLHKFTDVVKGYMK